MLSTPSATLRSQSQTPASRRRIRTLWRRWALRRTSSLACFSCASESQRSSNERAAAHLQLMCSAALEILRCCFNHHVLMKRSCTTMKTLHHMCFKSVSFPSCISLSAAGTWPWDPWSRFPWTCSSCTCPATPSQFSPLWWSAWWPGGQYRLLCLCLPVSIFKVASVNRPNDAVSFGPALWPFNHSVFFCLQAFKLLESSSQQWLQGLVYLIGNLLGSALAIYKCQSMGLLPTHSSDWLAFIEPPQVSV